MEKIAIITDSCADVTQENREKYDIFVVPMVVINGDREYKDGITINAAEVYEQQKSEVLKTASPTGEDVLDTFSKIKEKGYTHAIFVTLASGLSGTFNSMRLLAMEEEELQVEVLDSKNGSIGYGSIVTVLAQYRDRGLSFAELLDKGRFLIENSFPFFSIDTLEHLERGGRIGKATAFVGGLLKIKPILSFDKEQGEIFVPAKVRGAKAVPGMLLQLVEAQLTKHPGQKYYLMVAHGGAPEEFVKLKAELLQRFPDGIECLETTIGAALSTYLGKGLLGAGVIFDN